MPDTRLSDLAPSARRLVEVMRRVHFGFIEDLEVRAGEPVFDPAPRIVRDIKLGCAHAKRPDPVSSDFALKPEVLEMLDWLAGLGDGVVRRVEVMDGLPRRLRMDA